MPETISFHFEGALADENRMNFYEAARFQYAAARLLVKFARFRDGGDFPQKVTTTSNVDVQLEALARGSFNINVTAPSPKTKKEPFVDMSLAELMAYVGERVIAKTDETSLRADGASGGPQSAPVDTVSALAELASDGLLEVTSLPAEIQEVVLRRQSEIYRQKLLQEKREQLSKIDLGLGQNLIAASAPLMRDMATALNKSANTLEVRSSKDGATQPVLFLNQQMAREIKTTITDKLPTPILGDITQFNKDNGWGKLKIESGTKIVSFSIPYDLLPDLRATFIENMNKDSVYVSAYFIRDRSKKVTGLIIDEVLPTPI